jgi:hypothetical protein
VNAYCWVNMLPLITLATSAIDNDELMKRAEQFRKRRESVGGGVEPPAPKPRAGPPPEAIQRANERAMRVEEDAKRAAAEEMRKLEARVFEPDPTNTDDASSEPYTSESDDSDEGGALHADEAFDDNRRGMDEINNTAIDEYVTAEQLESIVVHMQEAYELVRSSIKDAPPEHASALFGVMTRLRADVGMLRGMIRVMLRDRPGRLIRSPRTVRDIARVDQEVQTIVNSAGSSNSRTVTERAMASMNSILPIINMLVYMLALYYVPGFQVPYQPMAEEIPVVYPSNNTGPLYYYEPPSVIEPDQPMPFVPNNTPTNQKRARGLFRRAVQQLS